MRSLHLILHFRPELGTLLSFYRTTYKSPYTNFTGFCEPLHEFINSKKLAKCVNFNIVLKLCLVSEYIFVYKQKINPKIMKFC